MDRKVGRHHEYPWPNPSHQLVLADQLARPFGQGDQNIEGATAKSNLFVAFEQQALKGQQPEGTEADCMSRYATDASRPRRPVPVDGVRQGIVRVPIRHGSLCSSWWRGSIDPRRRSPWRADRNLMIWPASRTEGRMEGMKDVII